MSELLKKIDAMLQADLAIASNEGFTRGVKWQRRQQEAGTDWTPKDRCESACCESQGPVYYIDSKIVTKEVYDNRNRGLDNDEFTGYEGEDYTFGVGTEEGCTDCNHTSVSEEFQPDDRYQDYNDAVWPGEDE